MLKARILFIFFIFLLGVIYLKLFYIQIVNPYQAQNNEYLKTQRIQPERGKIFDRHKQPLVVNQVKYLMYAEPTKIVDRQETIEKIDKVLHIGEATIESRLNPTKQWVAIQPRVSSNQKEQLTKMGIKGLGFDEEYQRYYPEASLAAHLVGFVGKDKDGGDVGYFGVEGYYDKDLKGLSGLVKTERDVFGRPILIGTQERLSSENGRDILLTVDKPVQEIVKSKLKAGVEKYGAKDGCVIVANPKTMEILALSCLPDFDADKYYNFSQDHFKNPAISNVYEPGSTFKPLIVASAIEQKAIKPDDQYNETGPVQIGEYSIKTWNNQYGGRSTITNILERSSNVGMVYIGQKMGNDKVYQAINRLGFGKATNIDLQGEVASYLKDRDDWYPIDYATVTFGQGIAVTPIQMITAFSAVINGGILMQPYVTYATIDNGKETYRKPQPVRRVFSQRTSNIMKQMLYSTVEHGEFKWAKPEGYKIGGKTGTAQIAIGGGYHESKTVASFVGFAPVDDPQFIAIVILTEPTTSQWGSETAAPLFFDIAKELLVYYNIPPDS